jgi:hypothetical protein
MALFKKGKKNTGGKSVKKGKKQYQPDLMNDPRAEQYDLIQPRENMERVEEDQEEDMAAHDESQQILA